MGAASGRRPPIGWRTKALYGAGAIAFGVKDNGFSYFLLFYYSQVVGLPASWVSTALMVALIADAVIDLAIGQTSDNWRSRLGRRHPFMYAAAAPVALAYFLLWNPPAASPAVLLAYLLATTIVVRAFIAAYEIPSSGLVAELTSDYAQRTSFFAYRYLFGWWGGLGMTLLALSVLLRPDRNHPVGQLNPAGYSLYGLVAGAVMLVSILVASAGTHSQIPFLKSPPPKRPFKLREVAREMFGTLSNRSLVALMLAALSANVAVGVSAGLALYVNTYFWELSAAQLSILLPGSFVGSALGVFTAPWISKLFGKRNAAVILAVFSVIISFAPIVLRLAGWFPANGAPALLPLLFGSQLVAVSLGVCSNVLTSSMLADVVEDNELATGRRSEGLTMASNTFVAKCVSGVGIFAAGLIISAVGFPSHAVPGAVDQRILNNLMLVYLPVQGVFFFAAIYFVTRYRITRAGHEANLRSLASRSEPAELVAAGPPDSLDKDQEHRERGVELASPEQSSR